MNFCDSQTSKRSPVSLRARGHHGARIGPARPWESSLRNSSIRWWYQPSSPPTGVAVALVRHNLPRWSRATSRPH